MTQSQVNYRKATQDDIRFICSTWLKSQRRQGDRTLITNNIYFENEAKKVNRILSKSETIMIVNNQDLSHLFGFCTYELLGDLFVIHFAYVKSAYQRFGLMKNLLHEIYERFGKEFVAISYISELVADKREKYKLTFNPYLGER
jgi:hypothetical protein